MIVFNIEEIAKDLLNFSPKKVALTQFQQTNEGLRIGSAFYYFFFNDRLMWINKQVCISIRAMGRCNNIDRVAPADRAVSTVLAIPLCAHMVVLNCSYAHPNGFT
ncbi:hypothetical protein Hgul01_01390 [Herpetosiphon gulosus]|uniref:Uncharacterized protein n=1 Tax=Herpetosiphon gulosus TaxID=1973496 RepID=A0ABP9WZ75_9CHLR